MLTSQGDPGNGISTGFMMVAAEELDVDISQMIYGSSSNHGALSNDSYVVGLTGGIGGSNSMSSTGHRIRAAAVAARSELLKLASTKLGVPVASLTVDKGVVSGGGGKVTYGELVGGKLFNVTLNPTTLQHGVAPAKPVSAVQARRHAGAARRHPGEDPRRLRLQPQRSRCRACCTAAGCASGQGPWLTDGFSKPLSVDESSIKHLKNVKVVRQGDFVGVVGPVEYEVVQAAAQLKVKWAESPILPGHANLWKQLPRRPTRPGRCRPASRPTAATSTPRWANAAKKVSASFRVPVQRPHADRARVRGRGLQGTTAAPTRTRSPCSPTRRTSSTTVAGIQSTLGLKTPQQARVIYYEGSSSFGNGYHYLDINESAALMSKLAGVPVRLQLMRWDEQGWNKYGPAIMHDMRAGVDANGNIVAYEAVAFAQAGAGDSAVRQLLGNVPAAPGAAGTNAENLAPMYKVAQTGMRLISKTQTQAMGMFQNGPLRAPSGPQTNFASEQIIDMLAEAAGMDPWKFRIQNIRTDGPAGPSGEWPRYAGVLNAAVEAAKAAGYVPHVPASNLASGNVVRGWGMGIGTHNDSYAATVAHVEVNIKTGKVTALHMISAQDSGFAINPGLLMNQMSGNLVQGDEPRPARGAGVRQEARHQPGLGHVPDPALQGHAEGHDGARQPAGSRRVRLGRAAAGSVGRGDRQRDLRRDGRPHDAGPVDAGPRSRLPQGRGQVADTAGSARQEGPGDGALRRFQPGSSESMAG